MPRIMHGGPRPALVHGGSHGLNGFVEAQENRLADQEMADIQLDDLRDRRDGAGGVEIQSVPRMDLKTDARAMRGGARSGAPVRAPHEAHRRPPRRRNRFRCGAPPRARQAPSPPP